MAGREQDKKLRKYLKEEAAVGQFTCLVFQQNEAYLVGYLNKLLHAIACATE